MLNVYTGLIDKLILGELPDWEGSCPFNALLAMVNKLEPASPIVAALNPSLVQSSAGQL